jgi:hypothetical protein
MAFLLAVRTAGLADERLMMPTNDLAQALWVHTCRRDCALPVTTMVTTMALI